MGNVFLHSRKDLNIAFISTHLPEKKMKREYLLGIIVAIAVLAIAAYLLWPKDQAFKFLA